MTEKEEITKSKARYILVDNLGKDSHYSRIIFHVIDYAYPGFTIYKMVKGKRKLLCTVTTGMIDKLVANYESYHRQVWLRSEKIKLTNKWAKEYVESGKWMFDL